ncbi:MAG: cytochrome c biogenesis protein ResB [Propionibacteriaceae bacterium]|nr:cytochrome c biogenesis protein ResB [Propionibacteriaceae bacterium]
MTITETKSPTPPTRRARRNGPVVAAALGVYRFFHMKKVGLLLILALSILALIGVLFPQVSPALRADPEAYQSWVLDQRVRYGGWTAVLSFIRAFSMFSSPAFTIVVTLLAISIIACTVHRLPLLWRQAVHPRLHASERLFDRSRLRATLEVPLPPEEATQRARQLLSRMRFRVLDDPRGPGANLFADRNRFAPFGTVAAHLAFVLILLGVLVSGSSGFREGQFTVAVGSDRDIGHGTGMNVEVLSFADTYQADGRPKDYVSEVILRQDGQQVARQEVRVNEPLRHDGVKINQAFFGVAADMRIESADGDVLFDRGLPLEWTSEDERLSYSSFRLDQPDVLIYVVAPSSGQVVDSIAPGQVRVEVYPGEEDVPAATEVLTQGQPMEIEGLTFTFEREQKFTGLMVSRDPGAPWVWVGSILLLVGTYLTMGLRYHRVWVRVTPHGDTSIVRIGCPDRIDLAFEPRFRQLEKELAQPRPPETEG